MKTLLKSTTNKIGALSAAFMIVSMYGYPADCEKEPSYVLKDSCFEGNGSLCIDEIYPTKVSCRAGSGGCLIRVFNPPITLTVTRYYGTCTDGVCEHTHAEQVDVSINFDTVGDPNCSGG